MLSLLLDILGLGEDSDSGPRYMLLPLAWTHQSDPANPEGLRWVQLGDQIQLFDQGHKRLGKYFFPFAAPVVELHVAHFIVHQPQGGYDTLTITNEMTHDAVRLRYSDGKWWEKVASAGSPADLDAASDASLLDWLFS